MAEDQHDLFALFEQASREQPRETGVSARNRRYRERLKAREKVETPTTKRCCSCKLDRPSAEFHKNKSEPDGLATRCRSCKAAEHSILYANRLENYTAVGTKECPDCHEIKLASMFYRQTAAKDGLSTYCRACERPRQKADYRKNRGRRAHLSKVWQVKNKALDRSYRLANRCRKRSAAYGVKVSFTAKEWRELLNYFGHRCAYCLMPGGMPWPLTADHLVPLSKGGDSLISNIVPACLSCNSSKGSKSILEFAARQNSVPTMET